MKKYTQEDFDKMPVVNGIKQCPTGDYTGISRFSERCSFGERCRFGGWCSFGERCRFGGWCRFGKGCSFENLTNARYIGVDRIGSRKGKTYFFASDEGYFVRAGCWFGTFEDFRKRLDDVYPQGPYRREYLAALECAEKILKGESEV